MSAGHVPSVSLDGRLGGGLVAALLLHGAGVDTVFDLLGRGENDMPFALGWGLTHSDELLAALLRTLELEAAARDDIVVRLQQYEASRAFTDIELTSATGLHVIIEAKRGWWLPGREQLALYGERFGASGAELARLVVCSPSGVPKALPATPSHAWRSPTGAMSSAGRTSWDSWERQGGQREAPHVTGSTS